MVIKQILAMIKKTISTNSCNEIEFARSLPIYEQALRKNGYKSELTFNPNSSYTKSSRHKKRNIIWFNTPFNNQVSTNIGKVFFYLLRKHFPPNHRLHKICNKNNIKLSFSCRPNMGNIITAQNEKLINQHDSPPKTQPYNCRNTNSCPLSGNCREKNIIYQATVRSNSTTMNYFGLCETDFKTRYYNHTHSFETGQNAKLPNSPNLYGNAKTQDQSLPSTGNRFVAHRHTNKGMIIATSVWRKNLQFLLQTLKPHFTKEPN